MLYANGVQETSSTAGTGTLTLSSVPGFAPFAAIFSPGDLVPYAISNSTNWEWGEGTVGAGNTLARTTVFSTFAAGVYTASGASPLILSGVSAVYCTLPAEVVATLASQGAAADAHAVAAAPHAGHSTPATLAAAISAHEGAGDPHPGYALESALGTAAAAATGDFEAAGAIATHNAAPTAHGISAFGATLVDDADAATARTTLGLGNVDNTSDANKPVSTAQQTALDAKAPTASPTFTGTVGGITAAMVGAPSGSGTSTGTNTGDSATPAETTTTIGSLINGSTSKTTPVDADQIGLMDSAASNIMKKLSWANIKAALSALFVPLTGNSTAPVEIGGVYTEVLGYSKGGAPLLVPGAFNRLAMLSFKGGSITSTVAPILGTLDNLVDNRGTEVRWDSAALPVTITFTLEATYSYGRQFILYFYGNYAPKSFSVAFYDSSMALLYSTSQTNWSSTDAVYTLATGAACYGTKTIQVTISEAKVGYAYAQLFLVSWTVYNQNSIAIAPTYLSRQDDGDIYGKVSITKTSTQLETKYDASNKESVAVDSVGKVVRTATGSAPIWNFTVSDATTNALYDLATFSKNSTGAGAAGLGARINLAAKSSTTTDTLQGALSASWVDATHATRKARTRVWAADSTGLREGIRVEADGTQVLLGFFGGNAAAKPTALTPTVAAAPAGGIGTAAGGWDTAANRDLAIATINNLKDRVDGLETKLRQLTLLS